MNLVVLIGTLKVKPVLKESTQGNYYAEAKLEIERVGCESIKDEITITILNELAKEFVKEARENQMVAVKGMIHSDDGDYELIANKISFLS